LPHNLPTALLGSLRHIKGFDEKAFEQVHQSGEQITSVRKNPRKIFNVECSIFNDQLEKVVWASEGFYLPERPSFTSDPLFHAGVYYVQEASSMFLEEVLKQTTDLSKPIKVLDLCAAPGGKSTLIQSLISDESLLISNEVIKPRVNILAENITKWGAANVIVTNNDPKDFQKYPITIEKDIFLLEKAGTDALFLPEAGELYPGGTKDLEKYELGRLETLLEGKYRPGHFQGVCQVMRRLLDVVAPDDLFMGQKDYQQCMVVARLLHLMKSSARLHPCPIVREADGLAMSSRNMRLTEKEREKAPAIYRALTLVKEEWGKPGALSRARAILEENGFRIDYVEIADAGTLEPIDAGFGGNQKNVVVLVAAFLGEIRLIDNILL